MKILTKDVLKTTLRVFVYLMAGLILLDWMGIIGFPFFEKNSTTLLFSTKEAQVAAAKSLVPALGNPQVILDTAEVDRYIFSDGTSVDYVKSDRIKMYYPVVALKQIVIPFWMFWKSPESMADAILNSLDPAQSTTAQIFTLPDNAFPKGKVVLLFAQPFKNQANAGFGYIIRRHKLQIGGKPPSIFFLQGWPN